jgi:hypothetical protein
MLLMSSAPFGSTLVQIPLSVKGRLREQCKIHTGNYKGFILCYIYLLVLYIFNYFPTYHLFHHNNNPLKYGKINIIL